MLTNIHAAKCVGIEAEPVTVEIDINNGIGIHLVGLADAAVKESLLRTITALQTSGYRIPGRKIVINLAPADVHKKGGGYDLPIALGIIAASGQETLPGLGRHIIMGELGLDGSVRDIPGSLPIAELAVRSGLSGCIFPKGSAIQAAEVEGINVFAVTNLDEAISILKEEDDPSDLLVFNRIRSEGFIPDAGTAGTSGAVSAARDGGIFGVAGTTGTGAERVAGTAWTVGPAGETGTLQAAPSYVDFADIIGQDGAKRGLEIAAAGGHNVIMVGAPGSGKSSLAKALPGILPPMTKKESLVVSKIYSVAGKSANEYGLMKTRPFRSPHYSTSLPAMLGGGSGDNIMPGEVSLAQSGVLFLDEYMQMPRSITESLRGPLEDRKVSISRLRSKVEYPASFMLVAAANPCPCGYYGEGDRCTCTVGARMNYMNRLSGPVLDRIDLQLWLHSVDPARLVRQSNKMRVRRKEDALPEEEPSAKVAERVRKARERQLRRFEKESITTNAEMNTAQLKKYCPLNRECAELLEKAMVRMGLSARAYSRILKLARTIADLAGTDDIDVSHVSEAISYRFLDKLI